MSTRRDTLFAMAAGALALGGSRARAQDDRQTISVLVGAASSMDFTARVIAEQLQSALGRTTIAVPRLGAGQRVALRRSAARRARRSHAGVRHQRAVRDLPAHVHQARLRPRARLHADRRHLAASTSRCRPGPPPASADLKELVAWAKTQGDKAVFGSAPGNGSLSHFLGISINLATGLKMTHIPYKDSGVGLIDLSSGRLPIMITGLSPQVELHKAGKIKLLAVSGEQRSPLVPDVPTLKEAGINLSSTTSTGLFGPAKMAPDLVARLHAAVQPIFANRAHRRQAGPAGHDALAGQRSTARRIAGRRAQAFRGPGQGQRAGARGRLTRLSSRPTHPSHESIARQHRSHACRPRHRDGRLDAPVLDPGRQVERAAARRRADAADAARREADRFPRQPGPRRRDGPPLPAPLRVAVPRPQRGRRHPLRLSRLEVRRRRQLRRHAQRARGPGLQGQGQGARLQGGRAQRPDLGLHGRAQAKRRRCRWSRPRCWRRADVAISFMQRDCNWMQALEGDIDTSHFGFLHVGHRRPRQRARGPSARAHGERTGARIPRARHAVGHQLRRLPHACARRRTTGASPTSSSRSGRRRRKASSRATSRRAPGCRWTTRTR